MVMTVNMKTMKIEPNKVLKIDSPMHKGLINIKFESKYHSKIDEIDNTNTFDHPYWVKDKGWCSYKPYLTNERYDIDANQLEVGDICYLVEDKLQEIKILTIEEKISLTQTYNLSHIENNNNFIANGILVHNKVA
jgi:intein/homing endonuclease